MEVRLTERDLWEATRLHYTPGKNLLLGLIVITLLIALFCYLVLGFLLFYIISAIIGAVVGVLVWLFVVTRYQCRRIFRQQKNLQTPYRLKWDDDYIYMESEYGNSKTPWDDFVRFKFNDRVVMVYYSDLLYNLVTMDAFPDVDSRDQFLKLCQQKIE